MSANAYSRVSAVFWISLFVAGGGGCDGGAGSRHRGPDEAQIAPGSTPSEWSLVRFERPVPAQSRSEAHLLAEIALPDSARATLGPPVAGQLLALSVALGQRVELGDTLATIRSPEMAELESKLAERLQVKSARQRALEQRRKAVTAGVETRAATIGEELAIAEINAEIDLLRAQLSSRTALGAARGEQWKWASPVAGVVVAIRCPPLSVVGPEDRCLEIVDTTKAELRVQLPQRLMTQAVPGAIARFHPEGGGTTPAEFTFARCSPEMNPRSFTAACFFRAAAHLDSFAVGTTGRAEIMSPTDTGSWRIARRAITQMHGSQVVFVTSTPERPESARPIPVEVRGQTGHEWLIEGEGLSHDLSVAVDGVLLLKSVALLATSEGEEP